MTARAFLDTNVLVYAVTRDDPRRAKAIDLVSQGGFVSVQVLNEFVDVSRRRYRKSWSEVGEALERFLALLEPPLPVTAATHESALTLCQEHGFRIYDGLIVAAAQDAGCSVLHTEDLQDGRSVDGLLIRNPFAAP